MSDLHGKELAMAAIEAVKTCKAEDIVLLNPGAESGVAEWFVICTGDNTIQNKAISDAVTKMARENNVHRVHKEGYTDGRWILIDYFDVVVNILLPDLHEHYKLEDLWGEDCPREYFKNEQ